MDDATHNVWYKYCIKVYGVFSGVNIDFSLLNKKIKNPLNAMFKGFLYNVPMRIRTPGLLIRSQTLYPAELWALVAKHNV